MLGTAGEERLAALVGHLIERNAAAALGDLDDALGAGVDAGGLIEQLFGCLRDCMVAAVGCPGEAFLYTSPSGAEEIAGIGKRWGLQTLLAIMQILDQTLSRMRYSTQGRILAELALVRISQLEDLDELSEVIAQLESGGIATPGAAVQLSPQQPAAVKKKYEPAVGPAQKVSPLPLGEGTTAECSQTRSEGAASATELSAENAVEVWNRALSRLSGMIVDQAGHFDSVAISAPNRLVIRFKSGYAVFKSACERPDQVARFEQALGEVTGQPIRVEFALAEESPNETQPQARAMPAHQRLLEAAKHPLVRRAGELFGAQPVRVDPPDNTVRN
jgi:DNA polymerase-3 subunit gamma/tau